MSAKPSVKKPCPFCGGTRLYFFQPWLQAVQVRCKDCKACGPIVSGLVTLPEDVAAEQLANGFSEAEKAWDKRR